MRQQEKRFFDQSLSNTNQLNTIQHQDQNFIYNLPDAQYQNNIFSIMASVDMFKRKHKILKYCILIIGLSGAGKTALYNCLANKKMIGNSQGYYESFDADCGSLHEPYSVIPKTFIPNIHQLKEDVCLIDYPCFESNNSHKKWLGTAYITKVCLDEGQFFKFLIVLRKQFLEYGGYLILKTLNQFLDIYETQNLDQVFLNSILLVFTKGGNKQQNQQTIKILKVLVRSFQHKKFVCKRKNQIILILNHLLRQQKIVFLKNSIVNQYSSSSQINQMLNHFSWVFVEKQLILRQDKPIVKKFDKEFQKLCETEQQLYYQQVQSKVKMYKIFFGILQSILKKFQDNICSRVINFDDQYLMMKSFIERYDCYSQKNFQLLNFNIKNLFQSRNFQKITKNITDKILLIGDFYSVLGQYINSRCIDQFHNHKKSMRIMQQKTQKMLEILCLIVKADFFQIFLRLILCSLRGFDELLIIYQISNLSDGFSTQLRDFGSSIYSKSIIQMQYEIIVKISELSINQKNIMLSLSDNKKYVNFVSSYQNEQFEMQILMVQSKQQLFYAGRIFQTRNPSSLIYYKNALCTLFKLFQLSHDQIHQHYSLINPSFNLMQIYRLCIRGIANCFKQNSNFRMALNTFELLNDSQNIFECYQILIQNQNKIEDRNTIQFQYVEYCANHGRIQKAISICQKILGREKSLSRINIINNKLISFIQDKQYYQSQFIQAIRLSEMFINVEDFSGLNNIIDQELQEATNQSLNLSLSQQQSESIYQLQHSNLPIVNNFNQQHTQSIILSENRQSEPQLDLSFKRQKQIIFPTQSLNQEIKFEQSNSTQYQSTNKIIKQGAELNTDSIVSEFEVEQIKFEPINTKSQKMLLQSKGCQYLYFQLI